MPPERRVVTSSPENSETPLDIVGTWVTPTDLFFVRNHFEVPAVANRSSWELSLDGLVTHTRRWSFADLAAMPQHTVYATVECAGNGRGFLREKAAGVQWGAGAIGHAAWSGVRLRDLLYTAGVNAGALEVVFEAADCGMEAGQRMHFSRSLPLGKALDADTIIALRMNGEWLEPNHGAPLRLFVPGWYGVASVKWLHRMCVIDHAYEGYFQTVKYSIERASAGCKRRLPIGPAAVKSEILFPKVDEVLGVGTNRVAGIAWAGEERVARVDVSTDDGRTWHATHLRGAQQPYSWCQWETLWTAGAAGVYTILARAHTECGQSQPLEYNPDNLGYIINLARPRTVRVTDAHQARAEFSDAGLWEQTMSGFAEDNQSRRLDVELSFTAGDGI